MTISTKKPLYAEVHNVPDDYEFTDEELNRIIAGDMFTPRQDAIMAREIQKLRAAMLHGAETVSNRDDLTDDFISMLTGRAKYLREKGEIKSPYLLERAAAALKGENADTTAIPNGWKLVPIDPTKDMLLAGQSVVGFWLNTVHCYSKMLAAAPAAPQQEVK